MSVSSCVPAGVPFVSQRPVTPTALKPENNTVCRNISLPHLVWKETSQQVACQTFVDHMSRLFPSEAMVRHGGPILTCAVAHNTTLAAPQHSRKLRGPPVPGEFVNPTKTGRCGQFCEPTDADRSVNYEFARGHLRLLGRGSLGVCRRFLEARAAARCRHERPGDIQGSIRREIFLAARPAQQRLRAVQAMLAA
jgi:hypothetical protein